MELSFMSAECKAFTSHCKDLCNIVEDPEALAKELTSAGIFGKLICDGIQSPDLSRVRKSSKLVVAMKALITADPAVFHVFLGLIIKDVTLKPVAAQMQTAYDRQLSEKKDSFDDTGTTTGIAHGGKEAVLSPWGARLSTQLDQSYDVYLSFVASDLPFAQTVYRYLTQRAGYKIPVVVSAEDMHSEAIYEGVVAEMINKKCSKTILILSPEYLDSEWGRYEATLSVHTQPVGLRVIPVVYKPCKLPGFLQPLLSLDYSSIHQLLSEEETMKQLSEEEILEQFWPKLIQLIAATADEALAIGISHLPPKTTAEVSISTIGQESPKKEHYSIFLSSTSEDAEIAENVCNTLQAISFQTFLPISDLMPGTSILEEVADTILQANCHVVIVLSTAYLKDALCLYECRLALYAQRMRGKCIIPIMYKECDVPQWIKQMFTCEMLYFKAAGFWEKLFLVLHDPANEDVSDISIRTPQFAAFSVFREELKSRLLPSVSTVKRAFTSNIISAEICEVLLALTKDKTNTASVSASLVAEIESRIKKQPAVFYHLVEFLRDEPKLSYLSLKLHSTSVKFCAGNLDGISYNATYLSDPIDSDGNFINWENYGISIDIPAGAVPQGSQLQIMMGCSLSIQCKLPDNYELVSPVYLILPAFHFQKNVNLLLEHWANVASSGSIQSLTFISAPIKPQHSLTSQPNYGFQCLRGGRFEVGSQAGKISVNHFCLLAIARCLQALATVMLGETRADPENKYVALLYAPIRCLDYTWTILFGVCVRSKAYEEVLRQQLETLYATKYRATSVCISFREQSITLDIPYQSAESQGFRIAPDREPCEVYKSDVDYALRCWKPMCHETYPPRIYLDISPVVEDLGEQRKLDCQLTLIGTKDAQGVKLRLKSPPTMRGSTITAPVPFQRPTAELDMDIDLMEIKSYLNSLSSNQVFSLGLVLGLTYRTLESMKSLATFLSDMLVAWLRQQDNVGVHGHGRPTWRTLETALRHPTVMQTGIADRLAKDKCRTL